MSRMIHSSTRPHSILVINWPLRGVPLPINLHSHDSTEKSGRGFTSVTSKYSCQSSCVADIMVYCDFEYRLCSMEVGSSSRDLTPRVTFKAIQGPVGAGFLRVSKGYCIDMVELGRENSTHTITEGE